MNRYEPNAMLHAIGGFTAALATFGTVGVAVLLPMKLGAAPEPVVAATSPANPVRTPLDVAARYRIEVIGSRKANSARRNTVRAAVIARPIIDGRALLPGRCHS